MIASRAGASFGAPRAPLVSTNRERSPLFVVPNGVACVRLPSLARDTTCACWICFSCPTRLPRRANRCRPYQPDVIGVSVRTHRQQRHPSRFGHRDFEASLFLVRCAPRRRVFQYSRAARHSVSRPNRSFVSSMSTMRSPVMASAPASRSSTPSRSTGRSNPSPYLVRRGGDRIVFHSAWRGRQTGRPAASQSSPVARCRPVSAARRDGADPDEARMCLQVRLLHVSQRGRLGLSSPRSACGRG